MTLRIKVIRYDKVSQLESYRWISQNKFFHSEDERYLINDLPIVGEFLFENISNESITVNLSIEHLIGSGAFTISEPAVPVSVPIDAQSKRLVKVTFNPSEVGHYMADLIASVNDEVFSVLLKAGVIDEIGWDVEEHTYTSESPVSESFTFSNPTLEPVEIELFLFEDDLNRFELLSHDNHEIVIIPALSSVEVEVRYNPDSSDSGYKARLFAVKPGYKFINWEIELTGNYG